MASVNKVALLGNCGRDPEVRYMQDGKAVCNVSLATTSRRKDRDGNVVDDTQWHRITFYDRLAEIAGEYVKKGKQIYVEGRIKYGKYTDKNGVEQNTTEIVASELQLLGGRDDNQSGGDDRGDRNRPQQRQQGGQAQQRQQQRPQQRQQSNHGGGFDDMDDDIPF